MTDPWKIPLESFKHRVKMDLEDALKGLGGGQRTHEEWLEAFIEQLRDVSTSEVWQEGQE